MEHIPIPFRVKEENMSLVSNVFILFVQGV